MKLRLLLTLFSFFIFFSSCFAENKKTHRFVDKTVAGFVVGENHIEKVKRLFGNGTLIQEGYALCYFLAVEKQFIIFELGPDKLIEGIIISNENEAECKIISNNKSLLITGKGIKLGDSQEKIIHIYGDPQKRESKDGILIFEYHTDNSKDTQVRLFYDVFLYFKENRLVRLAIHDGE